MIGFRTVLFALAALGAAVMAGPGTAAAEDATRALRVAERVDDVRAWIDDIAYLQDPRERRIEITALRNVLFRLARRNSHDPGQIARLNDGPIFTLQQRVAQMAASWGFQDLANYGYGFVGEHGFGGHRDELGRIDPYGPGSNLEPPRRGSSER